jgi:DNA-binding transcriptional LysR family regulator
MLDMRRLMILRAVAAEGSIAAAGRALRYTRSAVSQQLAVLEAETGAALVDRTANQVALTPAGRLLVEHAERILVEVRAAEANLAGAGVGARAQIGGSLRVGIPMRDGPQAISVALAEIRRQFPDTRVELSAITDEAGAGAVRRGRLDLAIVSRYGVASGGGESGLREWVIRRDPLRLCVPEDHPLADAECCEPGRLADERWVLRPDSALGRLIVALCTLAGFQPRIAATVEDVGTALGMVWVGWGITIAPEQAPGPAHSRVVRLPIAGLDAVRHSVLVVRDGEHLSPRMAAVISAVRAASA